MRRDRFDRLYLLIALIVVIAIAALLSGFGDAGVAGAGSKRNPALERAMQERARANFLLELYAPVEKLVALGNYTEAMLTLQGLEKTYPGEAHTAIMRGSILVKQGVLGEGLLQYTAAVKTNGDYVDAKSSLNRRDELTRLVDSALPRIRQSIKQASTPSLERSLKDVYYLQSRLAGGCE